MIRQPSQSDVKLAVWPQAAAIFILLSILVLVPYLRVIDYGFVADDDIYLGVRNDSLLQLPVAELWRLVVERTNPWEYLPVRDLTYWIDASVFGVFPDGFHGMNLLWYAATLMAIFFAIRETLRFIQVDADEAKIAVLSCLGVLLFASHPAHVEPVVWISGRKDILSGFFVFCAWPALLWTIRSRWPIRGVLLVMICSTAACFSKGAAMAAVGLFLVMAVAGLLEQRRRGEFDGARQGITLAISLAALVLIALKLHGQVASETGVSLTNDPGIFNLVDRTSRILSANLVLVAAPVEMRIFHDVYALGAWHWLVSFALMAIFLISLWGLVSARATLLSLAILWLVVPLTPYLQVLPFSTWSMASERFVYLASFGWVLFLLAVLAQARWSVVYAFVAVWLVFSFPTVSQRIGEWESERGLLLREAMLAPGYFVSARYAIDVSIRQGRLVDAIKGVDSIERVDAREIMRQAVGHLDFSKRLEETEPDGKKRRIRYCQSLREFDGQLAKEFAKIPKERDLTYNNFLRNIVLMVYPGRKFPKSCSLGNERLPLLPSGQLIES